MNILKKFFKWIFSQDCDVCKYDEVCEWYGSGKNCVHGRMDMVEWEDKNNGEYN